MKSSNEYEQLLAPVRECFALSPGVQANKVEPERCLFGVIPIALLRAGEEGMDLNLRVKVLLIRACPLSFAFPGAHGLVQL
jgi:hypothetical protein